MLFSVRLALFLGVWKIFTSQCIRFCLVSFITIIRALITSHECHNRLMVGSCTRRTVAVKNLMQSMLRWKPLKMILLASAYLHFKHSNQCSNHLHLNRNFINFVNYSRITSQMLMLISAVLLKLIDSYFESLSLSLWPKLNTILVALLWKCSIVLCALCDALKSIYVQALPLKHH